MHAKMSVTGYVAEVESLALDFPLEVSDALNISPNFTPEDLRIAAELDYYSENPTYLDLFESEYDDN